MYFRRNYILYNINIARTVIIQFKLLAITLEYGLFNKKAAKKMVRNEFA